MLKRAVLWIRSNLFRRRYEREMREEMQEHLDRATRRLMGRGLPVEEARRQARREFGDVAYHQTEAREARGTLWFDDLWGDARFAVRHFARTPGTTLMMFIVLAAGLSISTLLFSWVHGISVMPPPAVELDDDLVRIRGSRASSSADRASRWFAEEEFLAYRQLTSHFRAVAGWIDRSGVLQLPSDPERRGHPVDLAFVTEDYFSVLGIQPVLGAGLPRGASSDAASSAVAVIDYQAWRDLFGQRPDIIGSTVIINGQAITIVGVAPARFNGARALEGLQVWLPLGARHFVLSSRDVDFSAVARLRPGVTIEAATTAAQTIGARADTVRGQQIIRQPSTEVVPLLAGNADPEFDSDIGLLVLYLGALGTLVLLVTCTNVSALLTGLASARRQEIAVRLSLGAPRTRIIRQLLTESAVLAVVAGAAALGLVAVILGAMQTLIAEVPVELRIQWPTTAFTFAIALGVGVLFGLSPALHATRLALASALRDSTGGIASSRARLQRVLVVAQIAFTQPLIVLMAAMLVYIAVVMKPLTGSDAADRVITLAVRTPASVIFDVTPESERRQRELMERVRDRMRAIPGVESTVFHWPRLDYPGQYTVRPGDETGGVSGMTVSLTAQYAEGAYFDVLGIPLKRGRTFGPADVAAAKRGSAMPVIISGDLATQLWGAADPVGRQLQVASDTATRLRSLLVVGVVDDPAARSRVSRYSHRVYFPGDSARPSESLLIRTTTAAVPLLPTMRGLAQTIAPTSIIEVRTMAQAEAETNRRRRLVSGVISAAGVAALVLSAIGLYAVIAFSVVQRRQEMAVRLAVGARSNQITYGFMDDGVRLGAIGLLLGLPAGIFAVRQLAVTLQMGELPLVPILLIATTGMFLVAAAAAWGPARRAAAVDPAAVLRRG